MGWFPPTVIQNVLFHLVIILCASFFTERPGPRLSTEENALRRQRRRRKSSSDDPPQKSG
jgi:hypothetical protein